jgi:hypothetical protein
MDERERCARIAEKYERDAEEFETRRYCNAVAREIRAAAPPQVRVVRPETVAKNPAVLEPDTIVAGQALIDNEIVDRQRMKEGVRQQSLR